MRDRISINEPDIINNQRVITHLSSNIPTIDLKGTQPAYDLLTAEGGESFFNYVDWLGLARDPGLIVLSSMHHYYYDVDDLKNVETIVNILPLNQIRDIKNFFHSMSNLLPQKSNFIGCFIDTKKQNGFSGNNHISVPQTHRNENHFENGTGSGIPLLKMIWNFLDSKTNRFMSRRNVTLLLEENGFKVLDMTELNGLTYFQAQKAKPTAE
jgi:hypothetical protein